MAEVGELVAERYRLEKLLGEGGMGAVYQAVNEKIGKRVAIKFLRQDGTRSTTDVERFRREARAAAAAGHRNIVEIYDLDVDREGVHYLVMELLEGESLGALVGRGRTLDEARVAYVACQILSALDAAHAAGIVHRDLKPDNVFLVDVGAPLPDVKLLDFGVSHMQDLASSVEAEQLRLTKTGTVIGSPLYMSPEQALGETEVDARTDVYAMGVILYEATTGRVPYLARSFQKLLTAIATQEPEPPSAFRPGLSPAFEAVILRALEKEPEERYPSAAEMFDALLPFVSPGAVDRISRPRSRPPRSDEGAAAPAPSPPETDDISLDETVASAERPSAAEVSLTGTLAPAKEPRAVPPTQVELRTTPPPSVEAARVEPAAPSGSARRWAVILLVSSAIAAGGVGGGMALSSAGRSPGGRADERPTEGAEARPAEARIDRAAADGAPAGSAPGRSRADAIAAEASPASSDAAGDAAGAMDAGSGEARVRGSRRHAVAGRRPAGSTSAEGRAADGGAVQGEPGAASYVRDTTTGGAKIVSD